MCIVLWVASLKSCMSFGYPIQTPWSFSSFSGQSCNGLAIDNETSPKIPGLWILTLDTKVWYLKWNHWASSAQAVWKKIPQCPEETSNSSESSPFEFFQCNKTCKNTANPIIGRWLGHRVFFLWLLVSWPVCSQIDANVSQTSLFALSSFLGISQYGAPRCRSPLRDGDIWWVKGRGIQWERSHRQRCLAQWHVIAELLRM